MRSLLWHMCCIENKREKIINISFYINSGLCSYKLGHLAGILLLSVLTTKQPPGMRYFCFPGVFVPIAVALLSPQMCNSPHSLPAAQLEHMLLFPASDSTLSADTWNCDSIPVAIKYTVLGLKRNEDFDFHGCQTSGPSTNTIRKLADAVKPSSFFFSWHKQNI